jgi:hypothetical protein
MTHVVPVVVYPCSPSPAYVRSPNCLPLAKVVCTNIRMNRVVGPVASNMEKYAGARCLTARGSC